MMKKFFSIFCVFLTLFAGILPHSNQLFAEEEVAGNDVFVDYQNYNHGYCPYCDCFPCRCICPQQQAPCYSDAPPAECAPPCDAPAPCATPCATPCAEPPPPAPACAAPCAPAPCAPVCGTECGISICAIGIGLAALITAAVLIISAGNGSQSH